MKKIVVLALVFVFLFALAACGDESGSSSVAEASQSESSAPKTDKTLGCTVPELTEKLMTAAASGESVAVKSASRLYDDLGLAPEFYTEGSYMSGYSDATVEEFCFFKCENTEKAAQVSSCLETRVREIKNQMENYSAENYEIASKVSVITEGNYVYMIMSKNAVQMQAIIDENLK